MRCIDPEREPGRYWDAWLDQEPFAACRSAGQIVRRGPRFDAEAVNAGERRHVGTPKRPPIHEAGEDIDIPIEPDRETRDRIRNDDAAHRQIDHEDVVVTVVVGARHDPEIDIPAVTPPGDRPRRALAGSQPGGRRFIGLTGRGDRAARQFHPATRLQERAAQHDVMAPRHPDGGRPLVGDRLDELEARTIGQHPHLAFKPDAQPGTAICQDQANVRTGPLQSRRPRDQGRFAVERQLDTAHHARLVDVREQFLPATGVPIEEVGPRVGGQGRQPAWRFKQHRGPGREVADLVDLGPSIRQHDDLEEVVRQHECAVAPQHALADHPGSPQPLSPPAASPRMKKRCPTR